MITLIVTILVVYIGWLVVKPLLAAYLRRSFARRVSNMFGAQGFPGQQSDYTRQRPQQAPRQRKRKIFRRDEGEYVEFEEVRVEATSSTPPPFSSASHTPREPQVSDAEWEELR